MLASTPPVGFSSSLPTIRNRHTRMAYMTAVSRFFAWWEQHQIGQLADIEPLRGFGRD